MELNPYLLSLSQALVHLCVYLLLSINHKTKGPIDPSSHPITLSLSLSLV